MRTYTHTTSTTPTPTHNTNAPIGPCSTHLVSVDDRARAREKHSCAVAAWVRVVGPPVCQRGVCPRVVEPDVDEGGCAIVRQPHVDLGRFQGGMWMKAVVPFAEQPYNDLILSTTPKALRNPIETTNKTNKAPRNPRN